MATAVVPRTARTTVREVLPVPATAVTSSFSQAPVLMQTSTMERMPIVTVVTIVVTLLSYPWLAAIAS
jgi:hypothetical protein